MKIFVVSIALLFAIIAFVYAQGNGIVNKVGKEQATQIVSGLTNGMPAKDVQAYFTRAGLQAHIGFADRSNMVSTLQYRFTNSGNYTVRWIDKNGEVKSAEQPNTGSFDVQFTNGFLQSAYMLGSNQSREIIKFRDPQK